MSFTMPSTKELGEIALGTLSVVATAYGFAKGSTPVEALGIIGDAITFYLLFK